ncbi:hypothetical protein BIFGAL_04058 [Bifidobacterium gallicum DSM 20093 = LMG 11596]|uniref:Uncharacterized protein n=1 Tax=Bifidobacterium gallicum DSM 20093 = LMG 11596 TaxID=561180 RepID=D1NW13_9BIFI|nr:hypothetical protein BIFGAL_04058 [Bifidobacterium gallicum DSM 20093 = LMG 11596]
MRLNYSIGRYAFFFIFDGSVCAWFCARAIGIWVIAIRAARAWSGP